MNFKRIFSLFLLAFSLSGIAFSASAQHEEAAHGEAEHKEEKKGINVSEVIFGHISDSHEWHLFSLEGEHGHPKHVSMPLPVIVYHPEKGLSFFSSSKFGHFHPHEKDGKMIQVTESYEGYHLELGMKEKLISDDGASIIDFSITKNVLSMLLGVVILLMLMTSAAKKYKTAGALKAPSGFQNALEAIIIFIRDEVARPNLGYKAIKFMPLLLTIFFFIWINNLLGLLPGGANFTGNIAVTACLAIISFIVMMVNANGHFWSHLLNPPNVPFLVKILLVIIEVLSLFIKPVALMIRLFANIMAGHIVILSVISMIFIFGALSKVAGISFIPVSLAFSVFMFMLELLVAAIQAFIFANLTAVFIGQAIEEGHGHDDGQHYEVSENEIIA